MNKGVKTMGVSAEKSSELQVASIYRGEESIPAEDILLYKVMSASGFTM
jgi:hypothetical protein